MIRPQAAFLLPVPVAAISANQAPLWPRLISLAGWLSFWMPSRPSAPMRPSGECWQQQLMMGWSRQMAVRWHGAGPAICGRFFGVGQMGRSAALSPVLPLSVQVQNKDYDLASSRLEASPVLYNGLHRALAGVSLATTDPFDGARFTVAATALLSPPPHRPASPRWPADQLTTSAVSPVFAQGRTAHYLLAQDQPSFAGGLPAQLTSLTTSQPALRYVADYQDQQSDTGQAELTLQAGFDEDDNSLSLTRHWHQPQTSIWAGQGV